MNILDDQKTWFSQNKTKPLFIILFPFMTLFYFILGIWLFKKNKYIKKNIAPIWNLINIAFLSSPATVFSAFILPMIFLFVFTNLNLFHYSSAISGIISQIPVLVLVLCMPIVFVDFKRSSILKRLFVSDVKKSVIIFAFVTYFMVISFISIFLIFSIGFISLWNVKSEYLGIKYLSKQFHHINWGGLFLGIFLNLFFAGSVGILISSYSKTPMFALAIGICMIIVGGFLTGQFIHIPFVVKNKLMNYSSYLFWQKYPTILIIASLDVENNSGHNILSNNNLEVISSYKIVDPEFMKYVKNLDETSYKELDAAIKSNDINQVQEKWKLFQKKLDLKGIKAFKNAKLDQFYVAQKTTILTPALAQVSIGVSAWIPIPAYIYGIQNFKWTTR